MNVAVHVGDRRSESFFGEISDVNVHCYVRPEIAGEQGGGPMLDFLDRYVGSEDDKRSRAVNSDELYNTKVLAPLTLLIARRRWMAWA